MQPFLSLSVTYYVLFVYIVYVKWPFNANYWIMIIDWNIYKDVFYII